MAEVTTQNLEQAAPSNETFGLLEAISANIKQITSQVKKSIKKLFKWGTEAAKTLADLTIPDSPIKDAVKSIAENKKIPNPLAPTKPAQTSVQTSAPTISSEQIEQVEEATNENSASSTPKAQAA